MEFLQRLPLPRKLSARVWLISLPSALVSFEKRQKVPRLPVGRARLLGIPLVAGGVGLALWAWRTPGASVALSGPLAPLSRKPATLGGIMVLGGLGLVLRSITLLMYALGLAWASASGAITVEEPRLDSFAGRGGEGDRSV